MNTTIHVAICDANTLSRFGIVSILQQYNDLDIIHNCDKGDNLITTLKTGIQPDVCILDSDSIDVGISTLVSLKKVSPSTKTLIMSAYNSEINAVRYIRAGANGYITKNSSLDEFYIAIKSIHLENYYYSNELIGKLANNTVRAKNKSPYLSEVEIEFLLLCCTEYTYKEIASKINLSIKTVNTYRDLLFKKLNVRSRTGLVIYAINSGLISTHIS